MTRLGTLAYQKPQEGLKRVIVLNKKILKYSAKRGWRATLAQFIDNTARKEIYALKSDLDKAKGKDAWSLQRDT
jgi:hypothetical protein